ncbi:hypothetical protein F5Y16DRAFT_325116 [Xylariaceae sp. FL0255]|nr:hypothetical protein F5Y16DRAFT_325116 [Xylariaceae sp. FL0255]
MSIFLDFDGTITTKDTVKHIADFALRFQESKSRSRNGDTIAASVGTSQMRSQQQEEQNVEKEKGNGTQESSSIPLSDRWDQVVKSYVNDYKSHVKEYHVPAPRRTSVASEIEFQRSQKPVELASLDRINDCEVFRGIPESAFREAGGKLMNTNSVSGKGSREEGAESGGGVTLRPGFKEFVRARLDQGYDVSVVSVNWSAAFIEGACGFAKDEITVYANEVRQEDGAVLGPPILNSESNDKNQAGIRERRNLTNSADKLDVFHAVLQNQKKPGRQSFYFGDSCTDIECLLEATKGIVIADDENATLVETLRRIGKKVPHVRDSDPNDEIIWASDYEEVMAGVLFESQ